MTPLCVIVIPFVTVDSHLIETVQGCLRLDYTPLHIALLPDHPVTLPPEFERSDISVIVTGEATISAKRNLAIRQFSDAGYFALIDSDAYPDRNWLKNGVAFLEISNDFWAVGGPNITPPSEPFMQRVVGNSLKSPVVSGPLYFAKNISASRECSSLHSCNLIIRRQAFDTIGGFDETLFTGEDRNLCDRIRSAGMKIWFHEGVIVYHHNRSLWSPFFRQRMIYGYCSASIGKRHRNRGNLLLHLPMAWLALFLILAISESLIAPTMQLTSAFVAVNLVVAVVESVRTSGAIHEIPLTFAAILVSYLATTFGHILALTGAMLPVKQLYARRTADRASTP